MPTRLVFALAFLFIRLGYADYFDETNSNTLFAFDDVSIPHTQNLRLEMAQPVRHPANPVLPRGPAGSVDANGVQFYGSILKENGRYRLWYVAWDDDSQSKTPSARWRAAYAESTDGIAWTKPNLGLVEYRGKKNNNLILMQPGGWGFVNLKVIADPSDPDPSRRYKMTTHIYFRHNTRLGTLLPFTSADGLTWEPVHDVKPVKGELKKADLLVPGFHFEPCGGLYQWDGFYYATTQNALPGVHHYQGRVVRLLRSRDFVHWDGTNTLAFVRTPQHTYLGAGKSREGEQNHEGISVWNRRNVLLGITGRWHGAAEWKDVTVDLGFVISNDGLHFREPKHEWTFLERGKDGSWDQGGLLQGQGFENIGDQTFVYYGAWDPRHWQDQQKRGGVGIATLPRDRFAALSVDTSTEGPGDYQLPTTTCELVTQSLPIPAKAKPRFYLNADGLGPDATLEVQLLSHEEQSLVGYHSNVTSSGFQVPIPWDNETPLPSSVKMRVTFTGKQRHQIKLSAIYVRH
ncbi:MAG: hypothetical protein JNJ83_04210 [Verrucomicrobiaceae bacterium]|nr:hypothetical protein [Verrucomicrobiaceae bacterium]